MPMLGPESREQLKVLGQVGAGGLFFLVAAIGGWWLDRKLGTTPWLLWTGVAVGIFHTFRELYRLVRRTQNSSDESNDQPPD